MSPRIYLTGHMQPQFTINSGVPRVLFYTTLGAFLIGEHRSLTAVTIGSKSNTKKKQQLKKTQLKSDQKESALT